MVETGLLWGAALSIVSGILFGVVGRVVAQRKLMGEEGRANVAFVTWWYTLGSLSIVSAGFNIAAAFGHTDLALHVTLLHVLLIALFVGLWGLGYYLAYLFTGNKQWRWILAVFYAVYFVFTTYLVVAAEPNRVIVEGSQVELGYEREISEAYPFASILLLLLLLPQIVGALAYFSLLFRVRAPLQRYRIGMVAGTFIVWFGSSIVAGVLDLAETATWWRWASRLIGVTAAFLILLAYKPPRPLLRALEARDPQVAGARE